MRGSVPMQAEMKHADPVDVVEAAWRHYNEEGIRAMLRYLDADVHLHPYDEPDRPLRGHDEILAYGRGLVARGIRIEAVAHRFERYDDCVVVIGRVRVLRSGGHSDVPMYWQADVSEGLITCVRAERCVDDARDHCTDRAAAA